MQHEMDHVPSQRDTDTHLLVYGCSPRNEQEPAILYIFSYSSFMLGNPAALTAVVDTLGILGPTFIFPTSSTIYPSNPHQMLFNLCVRAKKQHTFHARFASLSAKPTAPAAAPSRFLLLGGGDTYPRIPVRACALYDNHLVDFWHTYNRPKMTRHVCVLILPPPPSSITFPRRSSASSVMRSLE